MCNKNISIMPLCDIYARQMQNSSTLGVCCMHACYWVHHASLACCMHTSCAHTQTLACSTYFAYVQDMVKISATCMPHLRWLHPFMCTTYVQPFCKGLFNCHTSHLSTATSTIFQLPLPTYQLSLSLLPPFNCHSLSFQLPLPHLSNATHHLLTVTPPTFQLPFSHHYLPILLPFNCHSPTFQLSCPTFQLSFHLSTATLSPFNCHSPTFQLPLPTF